jgi:hypothetical protein
MPAANKTDNIELNQWLGNEYPKREDFNADNLKIDTAIKAVQDTQAAHSADYAHQYAADSGSTDAYAITLDPAPVAYITGQHFWFKANTANTGSASLNVNSLGAVPIKKDYNQDLDTGDIVVGQLVHVIYDGTNFQLLSRIGMLLKTGSFTRDISLASGTQSITGIGFSPKIVIFLATVNVAAGKMSIGINIPSAGVCLYDANSSVAGSYGYDDNAIVMYTDSSNKYQGVIQNMDSDGFTISWTKTGSLTGTVGVKFLAIK